MTVSEQIKNYDKIFTFHTVFGLMIETVPFMYCVEIYLDFSLIFCARYIHFELLLKASVLLTNSKLVISDKYILKERNKKITRFCCKVYCWHFLNPFIYNSAVLDGSFLFIYIRWSNSSQRSGRFSCPKGNIETSKNT